MVGSSSISFLPFSFTNIQSILPIYLIGKERLPLGASTSQDGLSVLVENDVGIDTFDRLRALPGGGSSLD